MGVAVQSHWFSVGTVVSWAEAGVGAVATQSIVEPAYGPLGLRLMKSGKTAEEALKALLSVDPQADYRQVAMVDSRGRVAVHTGKLCIAEAGHTTGNQFSCQANMMLKNTVWNAMAKAYQSTEGDLIDKLVSALEAAQSEGGDIRGKQSAAILVVKPVSTGNIWKDKVIDIRIDDNPEPIKELKRIVHLYRAYNHMNKGDEYLGNNEIDKALKEYKTASEMVPENIEMLFWRAETMAAVGKVNESLPLFKTVFEKEPIWAELLKRLPKSKIFPDDPELMKKILGVIKK
ncbi:Zn-dependent protease [candidate division KSB1 bacterium]|nr:MAG: Zn-dependent protease [candidate division KSB1 bacterium]